MPDVRIKAKVDLKLRVRPRLSVGSEAWLSLHEYFKSQKTRFVHLAGLIDLSDMQAYAMYLLGEPLPMGELAHRLGCDSSNVTHIVDRLESRGLIERRPSPDDRRVKLLVVTKQGAELRRKVVEKFVEPPPGIASLSAAEQRTLRDLLRKALAAEQETRGAA